MRKLLFLLTTSIFVLASCKSKEDKAIVSSLETIYFQLSNNDLSILTPSGDCPFYNAEKYSGSVVLNDFLRDIKFSNPDNIKISYSNESTATISYNVKFSSSRIVNNGEKVKVDAKYIGGKWRFDITNFFGIYIVDQTQKIEKEATGVSDSLRADDKLQEHISDSLSKVYNTK